MKKEKWKDVGGYEGLYRISTQKCGVKVCVIYAISAGNTWKHVKI